MSGFTMLVKGSHQNIKLHMKNQYNSSVPLPNNTSENDEPSRDDLTGDEPLPTSKAYYDILDSPDLDIDVSVVMESTGEFSVNGSLLEMDTRIGEEFTTSHKILDGRTYPDFGTTSSDMRFGQGFQIYHDQNELFGGFR